MLVVHDTVFSKTDSFTPTCFNAMLSILASCPKYETKMLLMEDGTIQKDLV